MRKATDEEKRIANTILNLNWLKNDERLKAIIESIIVNWWTANYSREIYPYIAEYYPELLKIYGWINQNFKWKVNCTVQYYTKWMSNFWWTEIFKSKGKWTGSFSLVYNYQWINS
jgi:hypothetical protein